MTVNSTGSQALADGRTQSRQQAPTTTQSSELRVTATCWRCKRRISTDGSCPCDDPRDDDYDD